jgi:hypothetical protein
MSTMIAAQRLQNQQLSQTHLRTPTEAVAWLGAVQAQEYLLAKWALGIRLNGFSDADIQRAFDEGQILRTHVMRPTWHFVAPADIRWMLELTAPRVHALNAYMYRKLELDDALLKRSGEVIASALTGDKQLTREELGAALEQAGIQAKGMRLGYIVHYAELEALICSGARRGKQFTYALLAERAPQAQSLPREHALAELVRRYFTAHGPATIADFVWWSGLTAADAKHGLDLCGSQLVAQQIDGATYWCGAADAPLHVDPLATVYLLPPFDEYTNYRSNPAILDPAHLEQVQQGGYGGFTVIDGQIVGNWWRTLSKTAVTIKSISFRPFSAAENDAFVLAAQRFADFVGLALVLS